MTSRQGEILLRTTYLASGVSDILSLTLILERVLGCASIFRLPLEHSAHEIKELLFFLSLENRNGVSNSEVVRNQVFADEFTCGPKVVNTLKFLPESVHLNLTIIIKKGPPKY